MNTDTIVTIVGFILSIIVNSEVTKFRLCQLEKRVDKHNNIIERTYKLEEKVKQIEKRKYR